MIIPPLRAICQNCGEELPCPRHEMKYSNLPKPPPPPPPPPPRFVAGNPYKAKVKIKMNYLFVACVTPVVSGLFASIIPNTFHAFAGLWLTTFITVCVCLIKGFSPKS